MRKLSVAITILAAGAILGGAPRAKAHGLVEGERTSNLTRIAEEANLVFVGNVIDIAYRKARIEGGEDEGELPYTIVTYDVSNVLRGKAAGNTFTMRFPGGPDGRGGFVEVTGVPVFQRGERDVLFVVGNGEKGCPLVNCEWGRFRTLKDAVYNTHGSPVRGLIQEHAVARGLPAEEFRRFSYPAPSFDELMKNPEAQQLLKEKNLSVEEARKRYEAEAPEKIEVRTLFPEVAKEGSDARSSEPSAAGKPQLSPIPKVVKLAPGPVPLAQFLAAVKQAADKAKRPPEELKSIDREAEIIVRLAPRVPQSPAQPQAPAGPKTPQEEAELKALAEQDFNPVIKH